MVLSASLITLALLQLVGALASARTLPPSTSRPVGRFRPHVNGPLRLRPDERPIRVRTRYRAAPAVRTQPLPALAPIRAEQNTQIKEDEDFVELPTTAAAAAPTDFLQPGLGTDQSAESHRVSSPSLVGGAGDPATHKLQRDQFVRRPEDENAEILCIFKLYMDSFMNISKVDMNDRLLFLVPLVIIYWRHRHPFSPFPFQEIDRLLRDVGQEAQVYRVVLHEVAGKAEQECSSQRPLTHERAAQSEQRAKSLEAIEILRNWMDTPGAEIDGLASGRRTGAREMRHWLVDLIKPSGLNSNKRQPQQPQQQQLVMVKRPESLANETAAQMTFKPSQMITSQPFEGGRHGLMSDIFHEKAGPAPMPTDPTNDSPMTSTEPYGWPHYGNKTAPRDKLRNESGTSPGPTAQSPLETAASNVSLINQLKDLQRVQPTRAGSEDLSRTGQPESVIEPSHYSEFFDMVSSIIDELNQLNGASSLVANSAGD